MQNFRLFVNLAVHLTPCEGVWYTARQMLGIGIETSRTLRVACAAGTLAAFGFTVAPLSSDAAVLSEATIW